MNNHIGRLFTFLCEINKSHSETKINSNSHGAPCSNIGQEQLQTSRLEPTGNQAFCNIDGKYIMEKKSIEIWIEISSIPFDFQTLELISKSLQPSQNPAKDPRETPEHSTSTDLRRGPWDFNLSSRIDEVVMDENPTCGVEAELGIQIPTETAVD